MENILEPLQDWELQDMRGFSMQRGHRSRVVAAKKSRQDRKQRRMSAQGRIVQGPKYCSNDKDVLPGRTSFKRKAGGNRCPARCGMCRPGRYHRAGGAKASKKVSGAIRGGGQRDAWRETVREARQMQRAIGFGMDVLSLEMEAAAVPQGKLLADLTNVPPMPVASRQINGPLVNFQRPKQSFGSKFLFRGRRFACKCCGPDGTPDVQHPKQPALAGDKVEENDVFVLIDGQRRLMPVQVKSNSSTSGRNAAGTKPTCVVC